MLKLVLASALLALPLRAAVIASGSAEANAFQRYSVLTPPGPDEPRPEILATSRRLMYAEHRVQKAPRALWLGATKYASA